jgi:RNA polymerase sigma factor (TIGR02999 family)
MRNLEQQTEITAVLERVSDGDPTAVGDLLPLVYDELRRLAESHLSRERPDHTLQATALVHEAYLKLVDQTRVQWRGRAHFFAVAAQAIRRILIDHARGHRRLKRGGDRARLSLDDAVTLSHDPHADLLALDDALESFAGEHPEKAKVVELRFFGGLTNDEAAEVLEISSRTIERHWRFARAWLYRALGDDASAGGGTHAAGA